MQRIIRSFPIENVPVFKQKTLAWAQQFDTAIWLDSNQFSDRYSSFEAVLAADEFTAIKTDYKHAFEKLKEYQTHTQDYLFGYLSYDLKNDVEVLKSSNFDGLNFADLHFFQPQKLLFFKGHTLEFHYLNFVADEIDFDIETIQKTELKTSKKTSKKIVIQPRIEKEEYLAKTAKIIDSIKKGDVYEVNFCQEFYAENVEISPLEMYQNLNEISKTPFASFLKIEDHYVLSASPERYLKKEGQKVISQPIKGTAKRLKKASEDEKMARELLQNEKERSENVMIVDLVRNDLSKTAKKGSIAVEELCELYSFKQVHQLISTIVSEVEIDANPSTILQSTFPMGSMTGAPKIAAMEIIENLETTKRGVYSGAIGYFSPNSDFDFNVVIRSILYNAEKKYVSYSVGSAITAKSIPENEYEECLLKAKAMKIVLSS